MTISKSVRFKSSKARILAPYPLTRTLFVKPNDAGIRRKKGFLFECGTCLADAKPAKTEIEVLKTVNNRSLLKCIPHTGRTHQIRLHLTYSGLPIIDDPIYGPNGDTSGNKLQGCSIKLQSSGIKIEDLGIDYQLDVPPDWTELIVQN
jgi:hypothetical protein